MIATRSRWSVPNNALSSSLLLITMLLALKRRQCWQFDEATLLVDATGGALVDGDRPTGVPAWLLCALRVTVTSKHVGQQRAD